MSQAVIKPEAVMAGLKGFQRLTVDYVFRRMYLDDDSWYVVRNTPGVTGFVGSQGKPVPLRRDEFNRVVKRTEVGAKPKTSTEDAPGEKINRPFSVTLQ